MLRVCILLISAVFALAQAAVVPLTLDGALEAATADSTAFNTGGKITVNGVTVTVPNNLQVQFPATFVPWKTFVSGNFIGNEVSITGNIVNGVPIAGLISVAQFFAELNTGTVTDVAFNGAITLDTGAVLRINDPNAVYSAGYTQAPQFTADDQNPSVTAFSGFPMCVPRSATDPKCPSSNRPAGQRSFTAPDSTIMAPIQVGDYIQCSGIKKGTEVICYNIVVPNVQILTTGVPPYIRVESALVGVFTDRVAPGLVEFTDTRFVCFTSDASVTFTLSRAMLDPCTGQAQDVTVDSAVPIAPLNRFIFRPSSTVKVDYARDYNITGSTGIRSTNGGQIIAGQFISPVGTWVFPESTSPGAFPPANDFSSFTWLSQGSGPDASNNIWGPLSPYPDSPAPAAPPACAPLSATTTTAAAGGAGATPAVSVGPNQTVRPGVQVNLNAVASGFSTTALTYSWTQTAGPTVTLSNPTSANAGFVAPSVRTLTSYTFKVVVTGTGAQSATASITIANDPTLPDVVTVDSYTWDSRQGGTLSVTGHSNVIDGTAKLSVILNNPTAGAATAMTSSGGGKFTFNAKSKNPTNGVTITSNLGGSASQRTLTARRRRRSL